MSDRNRELTMRFYELVNSGDVDGFMELVAEDFHDHEEFPGLPSDREGVRQFFILMRSAFPDLRMEPRHVVAEGDLVAVHLTMTGTHQGDFMGLQPTGRRMEIPAMDLVRIRDDRAVEHWGVTDNLAMMQQLGAMPEEAATG
ncbi:MAG TPA: ester cyclase [Solirubrobacteraceae bacterium]|jgi:steroid delta-isomerase-like uncharacterized protein|nr:ester cyclase [Solirubrobacteraceae bacterium]